MKKQKKIQMKRKFRAFLIITGFIFLPTTMVFQNCAPAPLSSGTASSDERTPNSTGENETPTSNQAPISNAGPDRSITLPASASLAGSVSDDGLPSGSVLTATWSKVSGPGTVTFANASAAVTTASFSQSGTYVLRLTASDGTLSNSDTATVIVASASTPAPANQAPVVDAGPDRSITLPATASLNGSVSDDGLPSGSTLTRTWSKVSGPGTVTFANASAAVTTASFSTAGTYVLRLTGSDGTLSSSDTVSVAVTAAPTPPPTGGGTILNVPSQYSTIQAAVNAAQLGDTIIVAAGATYTESIELKYKSTGSGYITIQSSALSQLPDNKRVSPADAIHMPKIQSPAPNEAVFYTQSGSTPSHHYKLVGLEITRRADSATQAYSLVSLGTYGSDQNTLAEVPHHFVFDRCYLHGADGRITRRGIHADASDVEITNSYFSKFIDWSDAQAILGINTPGNHLIVNNYLEATGENILYGGGDPSIPNLIPSNILIEKNHFVKPLSWKGNEPGTVKNLLELKLGDNVTIRNNILENSWEHGQRGAAFVITIRNQDGSAPWSTIRNVTIEYNLIKNSNQAFALLTGDYEHGPNGSQPMQNIFIKNNLFIGSTTGDFLTNMVNAHTGMQAENIVFDHNTFILKGGWNQFMHLVDNTNRVNGLKINNNIHTGVLQGGWVSQENPDRYGTAALNNFAGNTWEFNKNVVQGPSASGANPHPATSTYISGINSVGFTNVAQDNYILSASSPYKNAGTDGKDIGADVLGINQRTACVISGNQNLCP